MKWWQYFICFILIAVGVFSSVELIKIFNVKSQEYGTAITIETMNNYKEISRFDYGVIAFDTEDYEKYSNITVFEPENFNGQNKDYVILFNDNMLDNIVVSNGKISGTLNLRFYDVDGNIITTSSLNFIIEYLSQGTRVTCTTTNSNQSVSYFNTYMELNGAVLKVVERS